MNTVHSLGNAVLAVAIAVCVLPATGSAAMSESEAARMIERTFDVEVLRTRAGQIDGRGVWLLTVMNRGGNFNTAYQVNTLAVDRDTGKLVPAFRHNESGYVLPGADTREGKVDERPDSARTGTWR